MASGNKLTPTLVMSSVPQTARINPNDASTCCLDMSLWYTHIHVCIYIYTTIHRSICPYMYMYKYMYMRMSMHMYLMHMYLRSNMPAHLYAYM